MAEPISEPLTTNCESEENVPSEEELQKKFDAMAVGSGKAGILKWLFNWDPKLTPFKAKWLTDEEYRRIAEDGVAMSWRLLHAEGWSVEKRGNKGDIVESIQTSEHGKVYRFTGIVDCPAKWLFEDLRDNFFTMNEWNPTIIKAHIIKQLAEGLDIVYQVTAGGGKGIVADRDFILLRRLCALDSAGNIIQDGGSAPAAYIVCGSSIAVPDYPPAKEYVRGVTKIGNWFLRPMTETSSDGAEVHKCQFQWLFSCDLKGKMPSFVTDAAFSTVMLSNVEYIRKHAAEAKKKLLF